MQVQLLLRSARTLGAAYVHCNTRKLCGRRWHISATRPERFVVTCETDSGSDWESWRCDGGGLFSSLLLRDESTANTVGRCENAWRFPMATNCWQGTVRRPRMSTPHLFCSPTAFARDTQEGVHKARLHLRVCGASGVLCFAVRHAVSRRSSALPATEPSTSPSLPTAAR